MIIHNQYRFLFATIYFAIGAIYSLLALYLEKIGFSGTQIGTIMSFGSLVLIFSQPFWGMVCDKTRRTIGVLKGSLIAAGVLALFLPFTRSYFAFLSLYALVHFFQGANAPISDTLGINAAQKMGLTFGNFRQFGAVGFAVAVFFVSQLSELIGLWVIFPSYCLAYVAGALFFREKEEGTTRIQTKITSGLKQLMAIPRLRIIMLATFCVFGPVVANNNYYALLFEYTGGTIAGVGFAFLLFSGSEAPVMKWSGELIRRAGQENTMIFAATLSAARWFWYGTAPSTQLMLALFLLQGLSVGLYIVTAAQFVSDHAIPHLRTTAMTLYSSAGIGMGGIFCQFSAGVLLDYRSILSVYRFFGWLTIAGLILLIYLKSKKFNVKMV